MPIENLLQNEETQWRNERWKIIHFAGSEMPNKYIKMKNDDANVKLNIYFENSRREKHDKMKQIQETNQTTSTSFTYSLLSSKSCRLFVTQERLKN